MMLGKKKKSNEFRLVLSLFFFFIPYFLIVIFKSFKGARTKFFHFRRYAPLCFSA